MSIRIKAVDDSDEIEAWAIAMEAFSADPTEEALTEVIRTQRDLRPNDVDFAAACVLVKILGGMLLEVPKEHRPRGSRAWALRARQFLLRHRNYLGEMKDDILSGLH